MLSADGLIEVKQVMQDGTKVKANAAAGTFRREQRLQQHLVDRNFILMPSAMNR